MALRRRKEVSRTISARPESAGHLLEVVDLHTSFKTPRGLARAVNMCPSCSTRKDPRASSASPDRENRVVAVDHGALPRHNVVREGSVRFQGTDVTHLSAKAMRDYWGTEMAMVFQDPMTSLNPS